MGLILSIFPGIDLLGRAFEEEGYCIVRGPDVLWGGDIRAFHPPENVFEGVIGGPPCQAFSILRYLNPNFVSRHGNLIPEFERVVAEAKPSWFLMENVPQAPEPNIDGYKLHTIMLNNRWLGEVQDRKRKFCFGKPDGARLEIDVAIFESLQKETTILASSGGKLRPSQNRGIPVGKACLLQGLPEDFGDNLPFTKAGKLLVIGNGVPLPMGRAMAKAIKRCCQEVMELR